MQASVLLLHWGSYCWAHNLWVLIIYLFFLLVMLPSVVPRLATDSAVRVFPGVWKLLSFLWLPSRVGALSLPLLSLFLSFISFPTSFWRQWAAFLGARCPLPAFRSCFVEFTQRSNVLWWICGGESGLPLLFRHHLLCYLHCYFLNWSVVWGDVRWSSLLYSF